MARSPRRSPEARSRRSRGLGTSKPTLAQLLPRPSGRLLDRRRRWSVSRARHAGEPAVATDSRLITAFAAAPRAAASTRSADTSRSLAALTLLRPRAARLTSASVWHSWTMESGTVVAPRAASRTADARRSSASGWSRGKPPCLHVGLIGVRILVRELEEAYACRVGDREPFVVERRIALVRRAAPATGARPSRSGSRREPRRRRPRCRRRARPPTDESASVNAPSVMSANEPPTFSTGRILCRGARPRARPAGQAAEASGERSERRTSTVQRRAAMLVDEPKASAGGATTKRVRGPVATGYAATPPRGPIAITSTASGSSSR